MEGGDKPGRGRARGRARCVPNQSDESEIVLGAGRGANIGQLSIGGGGGRPSSAVSSKSDPSSISSNLSITSRSSMDDTSSSFTSPPESILGSEYGGSIPSSCGTRADSNVPDCSLPSTPGRSSGAPRPSSNYAQDNAIVRTIKDGWNKVGTEGAQINVVTNYYEMNKTPGFQLFQMRVDFTPIEDHTKLKKALIRQHEAILGKYVFDGSVMYRTRLLPPEHQTLTSKSMTGDTVYTINIKTVGVVDPEDSMYLQFYNIVMRKAMSLLGMEELGRNMYDRGFAIKFPEDRLELWPGFVTAIRNHEIGTLLCVEVTHKVLRTNTVLDLMMIVKRTCGQTPLEFEKAVRAEIEDTIIMTHYNRKTYLISDIDFKTTPASSFRGQDGTIQTYAEYYQRRYGLEIEEALMGQPMLVSRPKKKDINKGYTGDIYLVPSLCNPTGLSDEMRKNFQLMKKLSTHLHMDPVTRKRKLDEFMHKLNTNEAVQAEFEGWNIQFNSTAMPATARIMSQQQIVIGPDVDQPILPDNKGDWTRSMKNRHVLKAQHLKRWVIMTPAAEVKTVQGFLSTLRKMGQEIGVEVHAPVAIIEYNIHKCDRVELDAKIRPHLDLDMVFFVLPNNQLRRYIEIKNYTTIVLGIPSQCYLSKNLTNKNLNSVASKVMIQMTAKMGGVPWSIKLPLKRLMVLGFDVYHCSNRQGESVGALVATSSPALTSYYSLVSFHKDKSELAQNLCNDFGLMLQEWLVRNKMLPDKIVMFRDGVGEGQVAYVLTHEIKQMKLSITDVYDQAGEEHPKMAFIIVTKKINTRAFFNGKQNLPVGTVLDTNVTLPERYDFFLVSQDVRQGTVSPTNYNVVLDEIEMKPDRLQLLAYKMCHLYYNWSGTVAVPAPCQYAHKLAYLTGIAVGQKAHDNLHDKLWYL